MQYLTNAHSEPADRVAVRTVLFRGERYEPKLKPADNRVLSSVPLPIRYKDTSHPNVVDLVGCRFGRFTVLGLGALRPSAVKNTPARWVVRCDCGNYTHRSAKAIRNPNNANDSCDACRQRDYEARKTAAGGTWPKE